MDDKTFNDSADAADWIALVEQPGTAREGDIYPRLKAWIEENHPTAVLEIGAGQGACSGNIPLEGRHYTGVEPSPFLLARAVEIHSAANRAFLPGNAYALPLAAGSFDAVFSVAVFHLLGDLRKAAAEIARVLKPGGHFLVITPNPDAYELWTQPYTHRKQMGRRFEGRVQEKGKLLSQDAFYLHTLEELLEALGAVKLVPSKTEAFRPVEGTDLYLSIQGRMAL